MKRYHHFLKGLQVLLIVLLVSFLLSIIPWQTPSFAANSSKAMSSSEMLNQSNAQLQADVEKEKQAATAEAERSLDQEAIAALEETQNVIAAIEQGKAQDAIQALERATGKIDILVARYPELAIVPVSTQVTVIDVAPLDLDVIEQTRNHIKSAINAEDYPAARELLNNLMSEIRTTTVNLPLATYPEAMKEAARLLNNGQTEQAKSVLQAALSTLVIAEQSRPLPLVDARTKLIGAVAVAELDQ
jgi:ribosome-associated translation inhibitor RaiA